MLTPNYLKELPVEMIEYYRELENKILKDVVRRLNKTKKLTGTAEIQLQTMLEMRYDIRDLQEYIEKHTVISRGKLDKLIEESGLIAYQNDMRAYAGGGKQLLDLDKNYAVLNLIKSAQAIAGGEITNITSTLGLNGHRLAEFYHQTLSQAVIDVSSGAFSSEEVIRKTIQTVGNMGLQTIAYKNSNWSVESAVRMTISTTVNKLSNDISWRNAQDMGQDLMELTAHSGARPNHAEWQGQIVSLSGDNSKYLTLDDIGYGDVTGFMGANCRHDWYPYFEGASTRVYSDKDLKDIDPPPFEYKGREYTYYEATQRQRAIERNIRKSKKKVMMYEEAADKKMETAERVKLRRYSKEYKDFSRAAKIKSRDERRYVFRK